MTQKRNVNSRLRRRKRAVMIRLSAVCIFILCSLSFVMYTAFAPRNIEDAAEEEAEIHSAAESSDPEPQIEAHPMPTQSISADGMLPILHRKNDEDEKVALTIDDCFRTEHVETILEMAKTYDIKLTFFPIGRIIQNNPDLWKRVLAEGHEIENHTYRHTDLSKLTSEEIEIEIIRTSEHMNKALERDYQMHFVRPPGGAGRKDQKLHDVMISLGYYAVAHWEVSSKRGTEWIVENTKPGSVLLFHATKDNIEILEQVIPHFKSKNYQMVTMNELYGIPQN